MQMIEIGMVIGKMLIVTGAIIDQAMFMLRL
jgi:hypothetical protein